MQYWRQVELWVTASHTDNRQNDFLHHIIPPFCISAGLGTLDVVAMEYIIALYPLLLIVAICKLIQFHDNGCKILVILWLPCRWCFSKLSWNIDLRSSMIDAFATFLLLTYSKLIFVTYSLLASTAYYNPTGQQVGDLTTYYNANVK